MFFALLRQVKTCWEIYSCGWSALNQQNAIHGLPTRQKIDPRASAHIKRPVELLNMGCTAFSGISPKEFFATIASNVVASLVLEYHHSTARASCPLFLQKYVAYKRDAAYLSKEGMSFVLLRCVDKLTHMYLIKSLVTGRVEAFLRIPERGGNVCYIIFAQAFIAGTGMSAPSKELDWAEAFLVAKVALLDCCCPLDDLHGASYAVVVVVEGNRDDTVCRFNSSCRLQCTFIDGHHFDIFENISQLDAREQLSSSPIRIRSCTKPSVVVVLRVSICVLLLLPEIMLGTPISRTPALPK